jgi:beta-galactosidase
MMMIVRSFRGLSLFVCLGALAMCVTDPARAATRDIVSFDPDWRFSLSDAVHSQQPTFDDSGWRALDVPHDWSIEGPIAEDNPTGRSGGFFPSGIGWYRKHFKLESEDSARRFFITFDGVMANSDVWINGFELGHRPYGYVGFQYELTGHLQFGNQENVLAVRCDNSAQPSSRWYTGAGIYRHVRLTATDAVHLDQYWPKITTPRISELAATVHVASSVVNQSEKDARVAVRVTVFGPDDKAVGSGVSPVVDVAAGRSVPVQQEIVIANPRRWNLVQPNLYRARTEVIVNDQPVDNTTTTFGIRECHFEAATGFWLNGKNMKLLGCAIHADGGAVGAAVPLGIWERRLDALRSVGCNAIRTAHNPPAPEFLDLCDRKGFLVMDEMFDVWTVGKTPLQSRTILNDYHLYFKDWWQRDVTDTVSRDWNHPSIVIYSAGNEIHDINARTDLGFQIFKPLRDLYHQLDSSRPVTLAVVRPNAAHVYTNGFSELMDVVGQNYREGELEAAHRAKPDRKILGTENHEDAETWVHMRDNPAFSGEFLWTGIDYLGESSSWPTIGHESGLFDRTIRARPMAFQHRTWWTTQPLVYIARVLPPPARQPQVPSTDPDMDPAVPLRARYVSDWTSTDAPGHRENVEVYTNCQKVELFLNDKSLGAAERHADATPLTWQVPFEPGVLRAVASNDGKPITTYELHTAGPAAKILLTADQEKLASTWDQLSFVRATVVDANGITVPLARDLIHFAVIGPGRIAAVDNADVNTQEPFIGTQRHAYWGTCIAIIKSTAEMGAMQVTATAKGLGAGSVEIQAVAAEKTK